MATSLEWRLYFEGNARSLLSVPWEAGPDLTPAEVADVGRSLKEFQAGERSEGSHLLGAARAHADRVGDPEYAAAVRLFIAEEQRHARDLGRFLTLNAIALVGTTFTDRVFRRLRHAVGGLEVSIGVLITAEIIAEVYYAVLRAATRSAILRRLCDQILADEAQHVRFQAEQLARLRAGRRPLERAATAGAQRFLFCGTVLVVWWFHRRTVRRGGLSFAGWWRASWAAFAAAFPAPPKPGGTPRGGCGTLPSDRAPRIPTQPPE